MLARVSNWAVGHWQLFAVIVVIYALWNTDIIWPFRVLVVLFHEMSHGAAAILTGGEIAELTFSRNEGGLAWTRGGNRFFVASAGYLGSLLIGAVLFLSAVMTRADRGVAAGLGVVLILVTALYIRDLFPIIFTLVIALILIGMAWRLNAQFCDMALRVIGLASMIYVPWDIATDTVLPRYSFSPYSSDAATIANLVGGTEALWGIIWIVIALVVIFATSYVALRQPSNIAFVRR